MPKRRHFTAEFKAQTVLTILSNTQSAAELCREHHLKPELVSNWKTEFLTHACRVFERDSAIDPQQARIDELERLAGKLSLELEIAKKVLRLSSSAAPRNGKS